LTGSDDEARKYAFKLLGYRGRSESELRERLSKKGFPDEVGNRTIDFLKKARYLDDEALADDLKRQAVENRLLGFRAAKAYLLRKGIPAGIAESALTYDEELELQNLKKLLDKKLGSMGNYLSEKEINRLFGFFARRGYSYSLIKKTLKDMKPDEEFDI